MSKKTKVIIPWENTIDDISEFEGFVYRITHVPTNTKYIGKKSYWSRRRIKVKGRKNRKRVVKESDWKHYYSSNNWIKEEVKTKGISDFKFEILRQCKNKRETTYYEVWYQFKFDVLSSKLDNEEYEYINTNISGKFFRSFLE